MHIKQIVNVLRFRVDFELKSEYKFNKSASLFEALTYSNCEMASLIEPAANPLQ